MNALLYSSVENNKAFIGWHYYGIWHYYGYRLYGWETIWWPTMNYLPENPGPVHVHRRYIWGVTWTTKVTNTCDLPGWLCRKRKRGSICFLSAIAKNFTGPIDIGVGGRYVKSIFRICLNTIATPIVHR